MKRRKLSLAAVLAGVLMASSFAPSEFFGKDISPFLNCSGIQSADASRPQIFLVFILDFNDFSCFFCLDSFLWFYESVPFRLHQANSLGLVVFTDLEQEEKTDSSFKIVDKKLRGFLQANHITTPFFIDRFGAFQGLAKEGTAVVLINRGEKSLKKFNFPLDRVRKEEVFEALASVQRKKP